MKPRVTAITLIVLLASIASPAFNQTVEKAGQTGNDVNINSMQRPGSDGVGFTLTNNIVSPNQFLSNMEKIAGEEVCFTLTAKDKNGNVIRDWNRKNIATTLTLKYSANPATTANTDTSTKSWNADPLGYSFAQIKYNGVELPSPIPDEWTLDADKFDDNGQAIICLVHTRADTGVYIDIAPKVGYLNQESQHMNFRADDITNYLAHNI